MSIVHFASTPVTQSWTCRRPDQHWRVLLDSDRSSVIEPAPGQPGRRRSDRYWTAGDGQPVAVKLAAGTRSGYLALFSWSTSGQAKHVALDQPVRRAVHTKRTASVSVDDKVTLGHVVSADVTELALGCVPDQHFARTRGSALSVNAVHGRVGSEPVPTGHGELLLARVGGGWLLHATAAAAGREHSPELLVHLPIAASQSESAQPGLVFDRGRPRDDEPKPRLLWRVLPSADAVAHCSFSSTIDDGRLWILSAVSGWECPVRGLGLVCDEREQRVPGRAAATAVRVRPEPERRLRFDPVPATRCRGLERVCVDDDGSVRPLGGRVRWGRSELHGGAQSSRLCDGIRRDGSQSVRGQRDGRHALEWPSDRICSLVG